MTDCANIESQLRQSGAEQKSEQNGGRRLSIAAPDSGYLQRLHTDNRKKGRILRVLPIFREIRHLSSNLL
jgi:hypothetical protein